MLRTLSILAPLACAPQASADAVTVRVTGTVDTTLSAPGDVLPPGVEHGDPFVLTYTYDPAAADTDASPQRGRYPDALLDVQVEIDGQVRPLPYTTGAPLPHSAGLTLVNDRPVSPAGCGVPANCEPYVEDSYGIEIHVEGADGDVHDLHFSVGIGTRPTDPAPAALATDVLTGVPPSLAAFADPAAFRQFRGLYWGHWDVQTNDYPLVRAAIGSIEALPPTPGPATPVPVLPPAAAAVLGALLAAGVVRGGRRRA